MPRTDDPAPTSGQTPRPRLVSLFAGIGGFDLGFERNGYETVFQCEINSFCTQILNLRWPHVPKASDIREVSADDIPDAEVWTGGFPCQDVSLARMGPRAGLRGAQSGLFFEFERLAARRRPGFVVIENVAGLLSANQGRDHAVVVRTLAELGYGVAWRVLDSRHFGIPQSRRRVFIVGSVRGPAAAAAVLFEPECRGGDTQTHRQDGPKPISPFKVCAGDARKGYVKQLAHCLYAESGRHTGTDWSRNYVSYPQGTVRRLTPMEAERLQGFPDRWTIPENAARPERLDSARYHACGNAVTVPVAAWIARRLAAQISR